jgi:pimeloyl-ACP methyl ester carboxylesterase
MPDIRPFTLAVPQAEIDDLHRRLDQARWPEKELVSDWSQGTPLAVLRELVDFWRDDYDWRQCEARLNGFGQYVTEIDGLDVHFLHVRSSRADAVPLIMTHGWPGSVIEFLDVIPLLTEPADGMAFHVIAPSLPGYGFSGKPARAGWGVEKIGAAWGRLMARLGYDRWVAQGGDWGAVVTTMIGRQAPAGCTGIHVNMPLGRPAPEDMRSTDPVVLAALQRLGYYQEWDSGYSKQQSTRPQTVGYGLVDSPVGLAGWILEKIHAWTDNSGSPFDALTKQQICDNLMLYWLPATGASAARLYWESFSKVVEGVVSLPAGASAFPKEVIPAPRAWAERGMPNLVYWNDLERGGHFAAWEQPHLFASELRACFQKILGRD